MQDVMVDGHQTVCRDGGLDLDLDGVLGCAPKPQRKEKSKLPQPKILYNYLIINYFKELF